MHTLRYEDEDTNTLYNVHHHGDFSGDVIITRSFRGIDTGEEFTVPTGLFLAVVAEVIRGRQISDLEQMSDQQILGLL